MLLNAEIVPILKSADSTIQKRLWLIISVRGLAKKVAGHQGLQLQKVVGPDEKL